MNIFCYNDCTAQYVTQQNTTQDVKFHFVYDVSEQAFGYLNEQNSFVSFKQGSGIDISDTTAISGTVLQGYYFYTADGTKTEGSVNINNASDITISGSHTYNSGYYPTQWTVSGLDTSDADATASNIESGKTAYVNGVKITGTAKIQKGVIKYYPETSINIGIGKCLMGSESNSNYAIFAGGITSNTNRTASVVAFNKNLTLSYASNLDAETYDLPSSKVNNYVIFVGGVQAGESKAINKSYIYNSSLTKSIGNTPYPSQNTYWLTGVAAGYNPNYAIFSGGSSGSSASSYTVAYNTSLTTTQVSNLFGYNFTGAIGSNIGNYCIISLYKTTYRAIDTSLTKITINYSGTNTDSNYASGHNSNYAIFAGGSSSSNSTLAVAIDKNLTCTQATSLTTGRYQLSSASMNNNILFAGGFCAITTYQYMTADVDNYDSDLVKSKLSALDYPRCQMGSAVIDNYALFSGGYSIVGSSSSAKWYYDVDVYQEL